MNHHPALAPGPQQQQNQQHLQQQQQISAQELGASENDLRVQLSAAIAPPSHIARGYADGLPDIPNSSNSQHQLDHSMIGGGGMPDMLPSANDSGGDDDDGRKGSKGRELSQSKRAAQNRAAQRAFRQRKEGYIKKLEEQVRDAHVMEDQYKAIQSENYSLREYIIHLQSRLIESHGEYPQPPPNISLDLGNPPPPPPPPQAARRQPQAPAQPPTQQQFTMPTTEALTTDSQSLEERAISQLQASTAQAVAREGLQAGSDGLPKSDNHVA